CRTSASSNCCGKTGWTSPAGLLPSTAKRCGFLLRFNAAGKNCSKRKVATLWASRSTVGGRGGAMLDRAWPRSHVFGRAAEPGPQGVIGAMQLSVTGKQTEIGEALRRHIEGSLGSILDKYFKTAIEAHVIVSKEA